MLLKLLRLLFGSEKSIALQDRSLGYKRTAEFGAMLLKGNFEQFDKEYRKLGWDEKTLLAEGIGLNGKYVDIIRQWVGQHTDSYVPLLFAGISSTFIAWQVRSGAMAKYVSAKNAASFQEHLEEAFEFLKAAGDLNPDEPEIDARLIRVCMGLSVEEEDTFSYFEAVKESAPNHLMAHIMMLNYLTPKWHGSIEKMHGFANNRYHASNNSLLVVLPLFAIIEEWQYYTMTDELEKAKTYFKSNTTKQKVLELYKNYQPVPEGRLLEPFVHNYFGFLFHMLGEKELARQEIHNINGYLTEYPWVYEGITKPKQLDNL